MSEPKKIVELEEELERLRKENKELKRALVYDKLTKTVTVPKEIEDLFIKAEEDARVYFSNNQMIAENGEIVISGERYVLIRSASLSYQFMDVFKEFYSNHSAEEATRIGNNFLFDIAHVLGREDAKAFHKKMNLTDPIEKLSAGPVHFAFTGWANVEILPESNPVPNEDYFIKYIHHNSFEAQSWIKAGKKSDIPVCIMNCGYSSGWCEESFGVPLTAVELECEANGADNCTFIMAPPHRIQEYLDKEQTKNGDKEYDVPLFFERKYNEDRLNQSLKQKETLLQEVHHRVKNNLQLISSLLNLQKRNIENNALQNELDVTIARVNTMAIVQDMIYGNKDVSSINIEKYFHELIQSLYNVYVTDKTDVVFDVNIDIDMVIFDPDLAIPLGLIVNEIACNSFKYAFEDSGRFYLSLTQSGERYKLIAGDNGKGIQSETKKDSLGMSLITILCEQIEAKLDIKNSSQGLEYVIEF